MDGRILKIPNQAGAWYWAGHGAVRFIPANNGMGTFLQTTLGWQQVTVTQAALNELVENFGQGPAFT